MDEYLKTFHHEEITDLLNNEDDAIHVSIKVNLTHLQQHSKTLFDQLNKNPHTECIKWNLSLLGVQKMLVEGNMFLEDGFQIKENCHVRFTNVPDFDGRLDIIFPNNDHIGKLLQIKGNVVRITQTRLLEVKRDYLCSKCKERLVLSADYCKMYVIEPPKYCPNFNSQGCKGILLQAQATPKPEHCIDYQEIRIQELLSDKNIPSSMLVTVENDLTDSCQPGDCIIVCGTIERRWKPFHPGKKAEVVIVMRGISVSREESKPQIGRDLPEQLICTRVQWQETIYKLGELEARDLILKSICPEVHGMYLAKLAVALSLCSGVERYQSNNTSSNSRGHSHLLLVGDPGLAKSKLIKCAAQIALRAVYTTGMGCSQAGLTAAAIRDGGEWILEAGALVLADGGICCIDEFNCMRETDKASIHEAMEQQTVSMAKAGIVCKLSTRCAILAATNHKNLKSVSIFDRNEDIDIGIASPLMSRFDVVLILRDCHSIEWDENVADHIFEKNNRNSENSNILTLENLQSHFLAVKSINPEITSEANQVLGNYYKFCRSDPMRDLARTTIRLLDSLIRLAQSHARLMFRSKVTVRDAVVVIKLMESSWGFGRLIPPLDILKTPLPLGPTVDEIKEILTLLHLEYNPDDDESSDIVKSRDHDIVKSNSIVVQNPEPNDINLSIDIFENSKKTTSNRPRISRTILNDSINSTITDEIFDLDNICSTPSLNFDLGENNIDKRKTIERNKFKRKSIDVKKQNTKIKKKSIECPPVEIPNDNFCHLNQIVNEIKISFSEKKIQKNLPLSSSQDIDLDEIFGDLENDIPVPFPVAAQPSTSVSTFVVKKPQTVKISTTTLEKLQKFQNTNNIPFLKERDDNQIIEKTKPDHAEVCPTLENKILNSNTSPKKSQNLRKLLLNDSEDDGNLDYLNLDF